MKILGIIPARYGSTRLPGKVLKDILGYPMIWWVYKRCCLADKLDAIYVATDSEEVEGVCKNFKIPVIMTEKTHLTAAHRLQEVSESLPADFYLQINGDEPLINIEALNKAIPDFIPQDIEFGTNIITEIVDTPQLMDVSNIKVVFDGEMNAVYMSRTPIPFPFKSIDFQYYKHVGIIGYNKKMLDFYKNSSPGKYEKIEGIDTLRFIDYGKQLKMIMVSNCHSLSVDTQKDLDMVIKTMKEQCDE